MERVPSRGGGVLQRSTTDRSTTGATTTGPGGGTKLVSILKKDTLPHAGMGMGRKQQSFIGRPKNLGRAQSSMSTRFLMNPSINKTVRFRLESERDDNPWLAQYTQPLDPRSLFVERWKGFCILFLSISFFRLPVIIAFGAQGLWMDYLWCVALWVGH